MTEARSRADCVVVSCHTHEDGGERSIPPAFLTQLAHACIDSGAHIFFSHGPHILRGLEMYRGRAIFYSLGAFIFRARDLRPLPEELYENCGMTSRDPLELFTKTSRGWDQDTPFWQSAIARVDLQGEDVTAIELIPTLIRHDCEATYGLPRAADGASGREILKRMQRLCELYGTSLVLQDNAGRVRIC